MDNSDLVLDGIKVVEIAEGISGPICGLQLADLGANVVKVEPPGGDRARYWTEGEASSVFASLNRGKRSVTIDLVATDDRAALMRLVDGADVVIVHLDPEIAEESGLDWRAEQRARPQLVVCDLTEFGQSGEFAGMAGSELVHQAMSGFMRYAGSEEAPCRVGYEIASVGAGMHAVQAVLAALFARGEHGVGDYATVSVLGQLLSLKAILLSAQTDPDYWAGFHLNGPHWEPDIGWETWDGQVTLDFRHGQRESWAQFCRAIGLENLVDDPDYEDWRSTIYIGDRKKTHGGVYRPRLAEMSSEEVSATVNNLDGISVKFHDYGELLAHPQMAYLEALVDVAGVGRQVGTPFRFDDGATMRAAPAPAPDLDSDRTPDR